MNAFTSMVNEPPPEPAPPQPAARVRPPALTTDRAIGKFVELRDRIAAIKKEQAKALAPFNVALATVEAWLLEDLNSAKVDSMRAGTGTVFKTVRTSASVSSWEDALNFIREREAWELLEARVSKTAVEAIIEETKQPVPGVKTSREYVLNVRRA